MTVGGWTGHCFITCITWVNKCLHNWDNFVRNSMISDFQNSQKQPKTTRFQGLTFQIIDSQREFSGTKFDNKVVLHFWPHGLLKLQQSDYIPLLFQMRELWEEMWAKIQDNKAVKCDVETRRKHMQGRDVKTDAFEVVQMYWRFAFKSHLITEQ